MTPKTKVLKILDKYRDMSLTMGCEVLYKEKILTCIYKRPRNGKGVCSNQFMYKGGFYSSLVVNEYKILGHPPTPLVLLKALDKSAEEKNLPHWYGFETDGSNTLRVTRMYGAGIQEHYDSTSINIPMTPTLSEVPEEHEMWQAVLDVLI